MKLATKDSKILIVGGGGTIGSSTALHLARRGYKDVRLLDIFQNPSLNSAGNDNNKMAGDDNPGILGQINGEAWRMWMTDPIFKDHAHNVGRLDLTSKPEREARLRSRYYKMVEEGRGDGVDWIEGQEQIVARAPHLAHADVSAWVYAHLRLTPEEAKALKGIATTYNHELGFIMEPEESSLELKIVNEFSGYTHLQPCRPFGIDNDVHLSVPRSNADNPTDTISTECLDAIKKLIKLWLPHLVDRPLFKMAMCWCTDTVDMNWLLCEHPKYKGLVVATGDSGQTFKTFPVVGKQVVDLIEGLLPEDRMHLWRWRPDSGDNGTGREGQEAKDLKDVDGWKHN
ncbi:uncharacterized protein IL334_005761 [Kwoniella shivajii]|uniref:FAD dependent oxidoreductase domain-containing protein n=1 Tax=Kwoniella shivajii TaxID=564305 RepID=A0ABZ1D748_9TREE|nr:hypothetical protein IL334_005761 [Kwoniella shivajii]